MRRFAEWSYRFLVPATLVLGTLAVVGTIIMYFVRVTKAALPGGRVALPDQPADATPL